MALVKSWERRGLWDSARALLRQCLAQASAMKDRCLHGQLLGNAGWFAYLRDDYSEALRQIRESLAISQNKETETERRPP